MNTDQSFGNNYVLICNNERVEEINERILARNIPDQGMNIQYQFRSQPTRYTHFKTVDNNQCIIDEKKSPYNISSTFNPGSNAGPWSGYVNKINDESRLRNQVVPRQNNDHLTYIPKDTSDLYKNTVKPKRSDEINNMIMFNENRIEESVNKISNNQCNLAKKLFNNDTRQLLKDS